MKSPIKYVILPSYILPIDWSTPLTDGRAKVRTIKDARLAFRIATQRKSGAWVMGGVEVVRADGSSEIVLC